MTSRIVRRIGASVVRLGAVAGVVGFGLAVLLGAGASARRAADPDPGADSLQVLLARFTGFSGKLRAIAFPARSAPPVTLGDLVPALGAPEPGVHPTGLVTPAGDSLVLLSLIPFQAKTGPRWRDYRLGYWPRERARPGAGSGLPAGFLEVTPENQYTRVSANFTLADFLTHDQREVWPKVLVLRLPLLDKLELIAQALADKGKPSRLQVMSGFRTPQYNQLGVGPLGGRARDSRHMYGDAADVFVDADRDGWMDDLTGDGRVTLDDARYLLAVAEEVETRYPALTGGLSAYRATAAHGPFVHVDVRGRRARW